MDIDLENLKKEKKSEKEEMLYIIHYIYNKYHRELEEKTKEKLLESYKKIQENNDIYLSTEKLTDFLLKEINKNNNKNLKKDIKILYNKIIEKKGKYFKYNTIMMNFM